MKLKRILSLFLSVLMILSTTLVFADEAFGANSVKNVTVTLTAQAYGAFLCAPQIDVTVTSDLAESYGYTDNVTYGVSALDVLVKAHEIVFEDAFTREDKDTYLNVEDGFINTIFGEVTTNCGFTINGKMAHDDKLIESEYGDYYTGYSITDALVSDNDFIEFFLYQETYATDNYIWFEKDGQKVSSLLIKENTDTTLTIKGYCIGWYGCNTQESIDSLTASIESAQLCLVDAVTGSITDLSRAITDENGVVTFSVADKGKYLLSAYIANEEIENGASPVIMPLCKLEAGYPDTAITIPDSSELFVGEKEGNKHFVPFKEFVPVITENGTDTTTYYFDIPDNTQCNYRISGENHLTYTGLFKKTPDYSLTIEDKELTDGGTDKKALDRNTASNNGYNVADIYLNINHKGYLKLNVGETYQLINLRNWEAVDSTINNYFLEPDYHYTVVDENGNPDDSIAEISSDGIITAKSKGIAIVLVTYDAMNVNFGSGKNFYGAIWPENTGVFVVGVDTENSGIATNMTINVGKNSSDSKLSEDAIDAEHDCIYYTGEKGTYKFTPAPENCTVDVANPTVDTNLSYTGFEPVEMATDGSFSVPLAEGRNIVKISKDGEAEYQIITAKKVNYTINNGEAVRAGDKVSIAFDRLYHPANKLAGVYNMTSVPVYNKVSAYDNKTIGGVSGQYDFASNSNVYTISNVLKEREVWGNLSFVKDTDLTIPLDYPYDTFCLSEGAIYTSGWGDPYGNHRGITLENGKAHNLNSNARNAYLSKLPDIEIPIEAPGSELQSISLTTTDVKTEYYAGDLFDTTNLVVTANYEDNKTQIATNYTVMPEVITADTQKVVVSYRGKTAEIPIIIAEDKVSAITVKNNPAKTSYTAGETFDPTGMVVEATYNSGKKSETYNYSYEPKRTLTEDDIQITISYTGTDADENVADATLPITVTSSGGDTSSSDKITVYFTLYGDIIHGTPENDADTHTLKGGNLTEWISRTPIEVKRGSYVIDVVKKALGQNGIPYSNPSGNYIESIKGIGEFANGPLSGWMYTLNGIYSSKGVAEQTVKNGDKIVFFYTDDYTKERESEKGTSSNGSADSSYTVRFETNGANAISSQSIGKNGTVTKPADPIKDGYTFKGWYTDKNLTKEYDFSKKVTSGFTLYAKWIEEEKGPIIDNKALTVFTDVKAGSWYEKAVAYVVENNLFKGVSDTEFEPYAEMTRAMLVTVLYRLENPTEIAKPHSFSDVKEEWYQDAIAWAFENGIVNGVSDTEFAPNDSITREQMAVILYRYAKYKNQDTSVGEDTNILSYTDAEEISEYAMPAMQWMVGAGLMKGETEFTLSPKNNSTRAQVATILMRYLEL